MAQYDYIEGKKRILEILDSKNETEEVDRIPSNNLFTFNNGYIGWVSSIFVDLRDSTELFTDRMTRKTTISKIMRSFSSEIIEILRQDDNLREIGIRGDCVYAIYASSRQSEDYELFDKCVYVNTFIKMFNSILKSKNMKEIKCGIGLSTGTDLVVKAGRDHTGINSLIWIGEAVNFASHLSNLGSKNFEPILISELCYSNLKTYCEKNSNKISWEDSWFTKHNNSEVGNFYGCNVVKTEFNNWISNEMRT